MFSRGGELLTQTEDIVGRWNEQFEELLNPTNMPSGEEAETEASGEASPISLPEVAEVVQQLFSGKAPGVDEIRPEMLKALDIAGLSWLTCLFNVAWGLGTVPVAWQTGVVVPTFRKGDQRVCSNYRGITLLSLPGNIYSRVLERRLRPIVEPQLQVEQCGFRPVHGTVDQLFTLAGLLGGGMDRISKRRRGEESVRFGELRIESLLFADNVVLLATSDSDLQHALGRFAAECEAVGMRVSTSKSVAMVFCRKTGECSHPGRE